MPDKTPNFNRYLKKPTNVTIPFNEGSDLLGFYQSWMNSPEYANRLQNNQYSNPQQMIGNRNSALDNLQFSSSNAPSSASAPPTKGSVASVNINPLEQDKITVGAHEVSHAIGAKPGWVNKNVGFNEVEEKMLRSSIVNKQPQITGAQGSDERKRTQLAHDQWKHLSQPEEIKADLDANRFNMFRKGVYDIRSGKPFTKEELNKAKKEFKDDKSFNRLLEQVGEDNYIQLMNTIASNSSTQNDTQMARYGGLINPIQQEQYSFGGILGGAASGAMSGSALGPWGAVGGALIGGVSSFLGARKEQNMLQEQELQQQQMQQQQSHKSALAGMNYGMGQGSNLPMAYGGEMGTTGGMINPLTEFNTGGTHESNPHGGIPQGINPQTGQQRTVEQNETKFKFKDGDYVFSDRLII